MSSTDDRCHPCALEIILRCLEKSGMKYILEVYDENGIDETDFQPIQSNQSNRNHRRRKRKHTFKGKKSSYHQQHQ